jgi:hypothetical protein
VAYPKECERTAKAREQVRSDKWMSDIVTDDEYRRMIDAWLGILVKHGCAKWKDDARTAVTMVSHERLAAAFDELDATWPEAFALMERALGQATMK